MPNRINEMLVKEYKERYAETEALVAVGYTGLSSNDTATFRDELAKNEIDLTLVKNRIASIAFRELDKPDVGEICDGQTAFATGEDPVAIARFLTDFRKEKKQLKIHGAMVEGTLLDDKGVDGLSKSPTKEELKGQIAGQAMAPGANLASALLGPGRTIAGQVKALIEKLEDGSASAE